MLVPVVAAVVLWLVTGSVFVLTFAALGPIGLFAQRLDARSVARTQQRHHLLNASEVEQLASERAARGQALERARAWQSVVTLDDLLRHRADHVRGRDRPVLLGEDADGMPVTVGAVNSIGVVARGVVAEATARTLRTQLRHSAQPTTISIASEARELPPADALITFESMHRATLRCGLAEPIHFQPHFLGRYDAELIAGTMPQSAQDEPGALTVPIGRDGTGDELSVDLAAGPHAIVAGASGSGKTEAVRRWLVSMCERFTPREVNLVLLDFKGGSGFAEFAAVPHTVCCATDLDERQATRTIKMVRSELTRREHLLLDQRVRSFDQLPSDLLPRLIVCIDEYQLLVERAPELGNAIADICARGRSLGIHLIIVTQHPTRSVRDHVLANCGLRILFRVNDPTESSALIGSRAAADLPGRGSVIVQDLTGMRTGTVSMLDVLPAEIAGEPAGGRWPNDAADRYVGLPAGEAARDVSYASNALLLVDDIDAAVVRAVGLEQLRRLAVIGPAKSGRTTTLARVAELAIQQRYSTFSCAGSPADKLSILATATSSPEAACVVIDDMDDLFAALHPEYRHEALRLIRSLMSEPHNIVAIASRTPTTLDELCDSRIVLTDGAGRAQFRTNDTQVVFSHRQLHMPVHVDDWRPQPGDIVLSRRTELMAEVVRHCGLEPVVVQAIDQWRQFREQCNAGAEITALVQPDLWPVLAHSMALEPVNSKLHFPDGRLSDVRMVTRSDYLPPLLGVNEGWSLLNGESPVRVRIAPKPGIRS